MCGWAESFDYEKLLWLEKPTRACSSRAFWIPLHLASYTGRVESERSYPDWKGFPAHSNRYFQNTCCVQNPLLGQRDRAEVETWKMISFSSSSSWGERYLPIKRKRLAFKYQMMIAGRNRASLQSLTGPLQVCPRPGARRITNIVWNSVLPGSVSLA